MAAALIIISVVCLWTAGLADWIVAYATGVAQLGIWLTVLSLLPFASLWVSLKRMPFTQIPTSSTHAHWSLHLKVSFFSQKSAFYFYNFLSFFFLFYFL